MTDADLDILFGAAVLCEEEARLKTTSANKKTHMLVIAKGLRKIARAIEPKQEPT